MGKKQCGQEKITFWCHLDAIRELTPSLNVESDSIWAKLFV